MKDNPVAWLYGLINRGRILFVEGQDVRTAAAGVEWKGRADQFAQEAKAGVKARSPYDAARLDTLSPYPPVDLPPGHPWRTPPPALGIASCTSSALCEANHPVSYHFALINRLEEIASDWRANPPVPPVVAALRGRPGHDKSQAERGNDWAYEMLRQPTRTYTDVAQEIAAREGLLVATVLREARRSRNKRVKAG